MRRMRRVRSLLRRLARRPRRCPFRRATGLAGLKNCNPFDDQPGCYALLLPRGFHARRVGLMDEMQEITREFLPIAVLWKKVPRLFRDLAADCGGKKVKIEMSGA